MQEKGFELSWPSSHEQIRQKLLEHLGSDVLVKSQMQNNWCWVFSSIF